MRGSAERSPLLVLGSLRALSRFVRSCDLGATLRIRPVGGDDVLGLHAKPVTGFAAPQ
jgi:hypothetical protein